ncbi:MAG: conjugal transfer protein TraF [Aquisalimonadaceae bacterium]
MTPKARLAGGIVAILGMAATQAAPIHQPPGAMLTHGGAAPPELAIATTGNPATASIGERRLRMGILSNLGIGIEIGDSDDFVGRIDGLVDQLDALSAMLETLEAQGATADDDDINQLIVDLQALEAEGNATIADLTDRSYAKFSAAASAPLAPLTIRSDTLRGVISLNLDAYVEGRAAVSSAGDAFTFGLDGVTDYNDIIYDAGRGVFVNDATGQEINPDANDEAGLAVQGGIVRRLSAGYARALSKRRSGTLHAGATLNFYRVTLARSGRLINQDGTADAAVDEFDENQLTSSGMGVDLGLIWVAHRYSAGATLRNINEPSFDYPDVCGNGSSEACAFYTFNPQAARNGSSWTMERQLTLEASVYTQNRRWVAGLLMDANEAVDTTGDAYQWLAVSASYLPARAWIPSPRVGYRRNLTGEELNYVSAGATLFRAVHIDVSQALEKTTYDGYVSPRALQANLGVDLQF